MTADVVTRDEFSMLRQQVTANARRLDEMDRTGTRGVAVLAVQVGEMAKDVGAVQHQMMLHNGEHRADAAARTSARRWAWGIGVTVFAALEAPLVAVLVHVH